MQEFLSTQYKDLYFPSPWIHFYSEGYPRMRWCQPDGVLFDFKNGIITIVEVKYNHTPLAWWQLNELYLPLVSFIFGDELWTYRLAEWVLWYDPATPFPGEHHLRPELELIKPHEVGVKIWKPGRNS